MSQDTGARIRRPSQSRGTPTRSGKVPLSALVVDDDPGVLTVVSRILQSQGFLVFTCGNGRDAVELTHQLNPSVVLLDILMPEVDGNAVCRQLRSESDVPIIMLTALEDEADAARALEVGADDYVRKPFGMNELVARVRAVLRRARVDAHPAKRLTAGALIVDERQHIASLDGVEMGLSRTEFRLLAYLVRNQGRVLTYDQVLEQVWGWRYVGSHHVLRVTMSRLRRKLGGAAQPLIETIAGVGYRVKRLEDRAREEVSAAGEAV